MMTNRNSNKALFLAAAIAVTAHLVPSVFAADRPRDPQTGTSVQAAALPSPVKSPDTAGRKDFLVTGPGFGALGDGKNLCTAAIQKAIEACHTDGGGRVIVPKGCFRTGTIFLKDGVELHLEKGASLQGSGDYRDFPLLHPEFRSRHDKRGYAALVYAEKASGIAISGLGVIDGNNKTWIFHPGLSDDSDEDGRPRNILFASCSRIRIEGITLLNPMMWNQHYLNCEDVLIDGITVYSHGRPNADGIDIDGCRRFVMKNSVMDSDDDGLTLKSTGPAACEDVFVTNCVFSSHCNAIKTGTESTGGFRNVSITHCVVKPSADESPVFKESRRHGVDGITAITLGCVDGGIFENIQISDITIEGTQSAIFIRLGKRNRPYMEGALVTRDSVMRNIQISNITAKGTGDVGCFILGLPGNPIQNLTLSNVAIASLGGIAGDALPPEVEEKLGAYPQPTSWGISSAYGFFIRHAENVTIDGMKLSTTTPDARPPLHLVDVKTISIKKSSATRGANVPFVVKKDVSGETIEAPGD
jgi:polygalacturonase